jgi:hypothetical protein
MKTPESTARAIIRLYFLEGWSQRQLADHFLLAKGTIQAIVEGITHQELKRPERRIVPKLTRNEMGRFERAP